MKFCNRRIYTYNNNNVETTVHYITLKDVIDFHGKEFADKWLELIRDKPLFEEGKYYFDDYRFAARQADSFLNTF